MRTLHARLSVMMLPLLIMACTYTTSVVDPNQNPGSDYTLPPSSDHVDAKILHLSSSSNVLTPNKNFYFRGEKTPAIYNAFLCIWADVEHLYEIATKLEQGEINDINGFNALLLLATLIRRMELERQNIKVPPNLAQLWEKAEEVHNVTRDVIERWGYKEIDASQVKQEMEHELLTIRQVLTSTEKILLNEFKVSESELTGERERLLEIYSRIYVPVPITSHED